MHNVLIRSTIVTMCFVMMLSLCFNERISIFTGPGGGHPGVTQSLLRGLQKLNVSYDQNNYENPSPTVVVLADIGALQRAILLKREGRIEKLFAGPNHVIRSNEYGGIIGSPEIDYYIVPSAWVRVAYEEDVPALKERIRVWPAGINEEYWQPSYEVQRDKVLVYWKTEGEELCAAVESLVKERGFEPVHIRYGSYSKEQFKQRLNQSMFAIFISRSESQGLALAEAWAMNVPTLAFDPEELTYQGRTYSVVSSSPYLTQYTGKAWKTLEDLDAILKNYSEFVAQFQPRRWVLEHMTDAHAARYLIDIIQGKRDSVFSLRMAT